MSAPALPPIALLQGDALAVLATLPDGSVQTCVTSPPYYGLRAYGTNPLVWPNPDGTPLSGADGSDHGWADATVTDSRHADVAPTSASPKQCSSPGSVNGRGAKEGAFCVGHNWAEYRVYVEGGGTAGSSAEAFSAPGPANAERIRAARWREGAFCVPAETTPTDGHRWDNDTVKHLRGKAGAMAQVGNSIAEVAPRKINVGAGCGGCGAWRGELGAEPTPALYVAHLVQIFREVRRVLRDDGTVWLNLGDSYNNRAAIRPSSHQGGLGFHNESIDSTWVENRGRGLTRMSINDGHLKEKDLLGIPWRVAFALQDDGWYLRNDIIWHKPSAMPESVKDRLTRSHEYVFLLSKRPRYYFDADAIKEPAAWERWGRQTTKKRNPGTLSWMPDQYKDELAQRAGTGRNKRTVWTINPQPYKGAHFATYPEKLVEPCVLAGSRPGDTVLDPFCGSGTTGAVAQRLGRRAVLIDANPEYLKLAAERLGQAPKVVKARRSAVVAHQLVLDLEA